MKNWDCTCEGGYRGEVYHCPMHLAAGAMYEALRNLVERHEQGLALGEQMDLIPAREALSKAQGK